MASCGPRVGTPLECLSHFLQVIYNVQRKLIQRKQNYGVFLGNKKQRSADLIYIYLKDIAAVSQKYSIHEIFFRIFPLGRNKNIRLKDFV